MTPIAYGNPDDGYEPDDPKSSGWGQLDYGARLQRFYENQDPRRDR